MILTINQTPVETTLNGERNLGDVLKSLQDWAWTEQQTIMSILINGRAVEPSDWTQDVGSIKSVELEVVPRAQEVLAKLAIVDDFFGLVEQALAAGNAKLLSELRADYGGVAIALDQVIVHQPPLTGSQLALLSGVWAPGSDLGTVVQLVRRHLSAARAEHETPETVFGQALRQLGNQLPRLPELSVLWQRGQDHLALAEVQELMSTLGRLQRTCHASSLPTVVAEPWNHFRSESEPFLGEIEQALAIQDFVLVGDLIEYELTPRLEALHSGLSAHFVLDPS